LNDIAEGLEVQPRPFWWDGDEADQAGGERRDSGFSMSSNGSFDANPHAHAHAHAQAHAHAHARASPPQVAQLPVNPPTLAPLDKRLFQSCPASIHSSPIPHNQLLQENQDWSTFFTTNANANANVSNPHKPVLGGVGKLKIAQPASNPFQGTSIPPTLLENNLTSHPSGLAHSWEMEPGPGNVKGTVSWEGTPSIQPRTIDPRWVSPWSSTWTTPVFSQVTTPGPGQAGEYIPQAVHTMIHSRTDSIRSVQRENLNIDRRGSQNRSRIVDRRGVTLDPPTLDLVDINGIQGVGGGKWWQ